MEIIPQKKGKINLGPKMPNLGIFEIKFRKTIATFEISTLKFSLRNFWDGIRKLLLYLNPGKCLVWIFLRLNLKKFEKIQSFI